MKRLIAGFLHTWRLRSAARAHRHATSRTIVLDAELSAAVRAEASAAARLEQLINQE